MPDIDMTDGRVDPLTEFDRKATIPIIVCAVISAVATSTLLTYLGINDFLTWRRTRQEHENLANPRQKIRMKFKNQGYFWLVNLFIADLLQAIGWGLSAYNLSVNKLWPGFACSVQGFFINGGDVSSSVWSLVIALHTFMLLVGGQRARAWASEKSTMGKGRWVFCLSVWAAIFFLGLIGPLAIEPATGKGPFYNGAGGGWCWIAHEYPYERIFFHYFFVFLDMIALTVLYCLVFIYIRIQIKKFPSIETSSTRQTEQSSGHELERYRWHADLEALPPPSRGLPPDAITTTKIVSITSAERRPSILPSVMSSRTTNESQFARKRMLQVARSLLWYPLIYLCLTTPLTIGRLSTFAGDAWGQKLIFVGAAIYSCAGWCNVLLYTATRKGIISWTWCGWKRKVHIPRPKPPFQRTPQPPLISPLNSKEIEPSLSQSSSLNSSSGVESPPIPPPKAKSDYFGVGRKLTGDRTQDQLPELPPPPPTKEQFYVTRNMDEIFRL